MRDKYRPEEKMMYVNKYFDSNKNIYNFCKDENLCRSTFYTWLKLYEASISNPVVNTFESITSLVKEESLIIDKKSQTKTVDKSIVKVTLPNGIKIECNYDKVGFILGEIK